MYIHSVKNGHVVAKPELTKSLSYKVVEKKKKIKKEFQNLSGKEIAAIANEKGREFLTNEVSNVLIGYSGDTPVEDYNRWDNTKILIHEATFLTKEDGLRNDANKHSNLEEVMEMVASIQIEKLILSHFSTRYSKEEIDQAILKNCKAYNIKIPIHRILPGEVCRDILNEKPFNG